MYKAKIVYASLTGNTEEIAQIVKQNLISLNIDTTIEDASNAEADSFIDYDICIVATYTYGDGEIPDDIIEFYEELQNMTLTKKVFGVCGSGDRDYEMFCTAIDDFETAFLESGAVKGAESVKIHLNPQQEDIKNLNDFTQNIFSKISKV